MNTKYMTIMNNDDWTEKACACNYGIDTIYVDYEKEVVRCIDCGHEELLPSYWQFLDENELTQYYTDPDKKVYDFGANGINIPANESVINTVREHLHKEGFI